jgi:hypothetical protein
MNPAQLRHPLASASRETSSLAVDCEIAGPSVSPQCMRGNGVGCLCISLDPGRSSQWSISRRVLQEAYLVIDWYSCTETHRCCRISSKSSYHVAPFFRPHANFSKHFANNAVWSRIKFRTSTKCLSLHRFRGPLNLGEDAGVECVGYQLTQACRSGVHLR